MAYDELTANLIKENAALSEENGRLRESIEAIHMFRDAETLKAVEDQSEAVE